MMKPNNVLFVNTLTQKASITISRGGVLYQAFFGERFSYSRDLILVFDRVLKKARLKPADLQGVVVLTGPGSYTSIRIGVSFANALGYARNIPVVGLTLFDALMGDSSETLVVEAGRGNVFYRKGKKEGMWSQEELAKHKGEVIFFEPLKETKKSIKGKITRAQLNIKKILASLDMKGGFTKSVEAHYILPPYINKAKKK